ncbi:TfoX/Sxy family DNA transformation protein, partial [Phaeovulum sp.]
MPRPLTDIPNIGPATAEAFARAGLVDADALQAMGADAAYARWLAAGNA